MDEPISAMPAPTFVTNEDLIPIVQSGVNYRAQRSQILQGATGETLIVESGELQAAVLQTFSGSAEVAVNDNGGLVNVTGDEVRLFIGNTSITIIGTPASLELIVDNGASEIILGDQAGLNYVKIAPVAGTVQVAAHVNAIYAYFPQTPSSWNGPAPTNLEKAIDRCAALLKTLNGGVGP
jgi:hypothetical protein